MEALRQIFFEVFGLPVEEFSDDLSPDTLLAWDSLGHIRLVSCLEDRYSIRFETAEIMDMINVRAIAEALARRGIGR